MSFKKSSTTLKTMYQRFKQFVLGYVSLVLLLNLLTYFLKFLEKINISVKFRHVHYTPLFKVYNPRGWSFGIFFFDKTKDRIKFVSYIPYMEEIIPLMQLKRGYILTNTSKYPYLYGTKPKEPILYVKKRQRPSDMSPNEPVLVEDMNEYFETP